MWIMLNMVVLERAFRASLEDNELSCSPAVCQSKMAVLSMAWPQRQFHVSVHQKITPSTTPSDLVPLCCTARSPSASLLCAAFCISACLALSSDKRNYCKILTLVFASSGRRDSNWHMFCQIDSLAMSTGAGLSIAGEYALAPCTYCRTGHTQPCPVRGCMYVARDGSVGCMASTEQWC